MRAVLILLAIESTPVILPRLTGKADGFPLLGTERFKTCPHLLPYFRAAEKLPLIGIDLLDRIRTKRLFQAGTNFRRSLVNAPLYLLATLFHPFQISLVQQVIVLCEIKTRLLISRILAKSFTLPAAAAAGAFAARFARPGRFFRRDKTGFSAKEVHSPKCASS